MHPSQQYEAICTRTFSVQNVALLSHFPSHRPRRLLGKAAVCSGVHWPGPRLLYRLGCAQTQGREHVDCHSSATSHAGHCSSSSNPGAALSTGRCQGPAPPRPILGWVRNLTILAGAHVYLLHHSCKVATTIPDSTSSCGRGLHIGSKWSM